MTGFVLMTIEAVSTAATATDASMTNAERGLIEPSLARIIDKMEADTLERANTFFDPVLVLVGLALYARRVMPKAPKAQERETRANRKPVAQPTEQPPQADNGTANAGPEILSLIGRV
ncbi:MAG: hypothetical protein WC734_06155 [Patescibacteria group bacterium]